MFSKRAIRSLVLVGATVLFPGCGSMFNLKEGGLSHDTEPYGGALNDLQFMPFLFPIALPDLPLSLIVDTVTLPYTMQVCMTRCAEDRVLAEKKARAEKDLAP
jgi:uncharacterized protein YceK